ncbi:uncharacterized protein [Atheta coriaria]|uniref:uncharacterized protein n=1 Tax=Dalotia coriaria TaxID=877792 RepID=UPI0031F43497
MMDKTKPKFKHPPSLFTRIFTKPDLSLPDGWASYNCIKNDQRTILLSQLTIYNHQPIMLRQIILQENLTLKYFVGKHEVHLNNINNVYVPSAIKMEADVRSVIATISSINICNGFAMVKENPGNEVLGLIYDHEMHTWRHKDCSHWLERPQTTCSNCLTVINQNDAESEITTFNTMDPQAHVVSTSSTPMETEDVLPSTSAIPLTVQHSANPAESNTLRNQITTLNMMDPCAHIPSISSTPMETEDALRSTSAILTKAEMNALRNREYRKRAAAIRTPEQAAAFARKAAERRRKSYHLRRAALLALASGTVETTKNVQTSAQRKRASRQRQSERLRSAAQLAQSY